MSSDKPYTPSFLTSLVSGGIAGTSVDIALYPLDTIKTRMQSPNGFFKAGGFKGIYRGIGAAAVGSAPGAALFFSTYEKMKQVLHDSNTSNALPVSVIHMISASVGEMSACLVRVPTEVVKQRMQAGISNKISSTIKDVVSSEGSVLGLYKGYSITIMREIPFALIQFPIYEAMKAGIAVWKMREPHAYEAAACGSFSGAIAAAATTPLDVIKTRLMLGNDSKGIPYRGMIDTMLRVWKEAEVLHSSNAASATVGKARMQILFAGVQPRVMWIGIGGFVFFGAYEQAVKLTRNILD